MNMRINTKQWYNFITKEKISTRMRTLNEISEKSLVRTGIKDLISDNPDPSEYQFNSIFDGKWRKTYPVLFGESPKDAKILYYINKIQNELGWTVDLSQPFGYASKIVKSEVNGKTYETPRKAKIGPLIGKLGEEAKEFWINNGNFYMKEENKNYFASNYTMIISRNPIDLIRMSDMDKWSSCHSVGASHWGCAKTEAKLGGAIAYVVNTKDLDGINLEAPEIFSDKKRNIEGVQPLARLRIRRFIKKNPDGSVVELAAPEQQLYGDKLSFFYDKLKSVLILEQKPLYDEIYNSGNIDLYQWKLKGGTYQDNNGSSIFEKFFDNGATVVGYASTVDQDESHDDDTETRLQVALDDRMRNFNSPNGVIHASVEPYDNNNYYILLYATYTYKIEGIIKTKYLERSDLKEVTDGMHARDSDTYAITKYSDHEISVGPDGKSYIRFDLDTGDFDNDINGLENLIYKINELDRSYDGVCDVIREELVELGHINAPKNILKSLNDRLKYFKIDFKENDKDARGTIPLALADDPINFENQNFQFNPLYKKILKEHWDYECKKLINFSDQHKKEPHKTNIKNSYMKFMSSNPQLSLIDRTENKIEKSRKIIYPEFPINFNIVANNSNKNKNVIIAALEIQTWMENNQKDPLTIKRYVSFLKYLDKDFPNIATYFSKFINNSLEELKIRFAEFIKEYELMNRPRPGDTYYHHRLPNLELTAKSDWERRGAIRDFEDPTKFSSNDR